LRERDSGVDDLDSIALDARGHHRIPHGVRDRDEGINAVTVLEPNLFRREGDSTRDDETRCSLAEQRYPRDGVRAGIVRVDDSCVPFAGDRTQLAGRTNVPLAAQRQAICRKSRGLGASDERRASRCDNERSVAKVSESGGEQKYLSLSATPAASGIDVKDPG
jgi:hypothetical protein